MKHVEPPRDARIVDNDGTVALQEQRHHRRTVFVLALPTLGSRPSQQGLSPTWAPDPPTRRKGGTLRTSAAAGRRCPRFGVLAAAGLPRSGRCPGGSFWTAQPGSCRRRRPRPAGATCKEGRRSPHSADGERGAARVVTARSYTAADAARQHRPSPGETPRGQLYMMSVTGPFIGNPAGRRLRQIRTL